MKIYIYTFLALLVFVPGISLAQENQDEIQPAEIQQAQEKKQAIYFYSDSCVYCQKIDEYFKKKGFYEKYDIIKYDITKQKNSILFGKILKEKGSKGGIPAIIIDEELLQGDMPIINGFERKIEKSEGKSVEFVSKFGKGIIDKPIEPRVSFKEKYGFSFSVLIWTAIVDAINPCAFAVLILLVATVMNAQGKKRALYAGLLFSLAVFISYVLMGFGVYSAITAFNLPQTFSLVIGAIAILVGLANLKDFFWYGKVFIMEVPLSWRPKMGHILRGVTSPWGALTSGFLVSLFLLPCTSGPYIIIIGLLADKVELLETIPLLLFYNLIFVAPMIIITVAVSHFGVKAGKLEAWRKDNLKLLHLIAGVIMVAIGIYLIQSWI